MTLSAGNPMGRVLAVCLILQALTFALAIPGMIVVSGVPAATAGLAGGGAVVLALAASGLLRRGALGYVLGWLTQVAGIALGVLTPWMYGMGAVFALLWVISFVLGRRLDAR